MRKSRLLLSKYFLIVQVVCVLVFGAGSSWYVAHRVAQNAADDLVTRVQTISKVLHRTPLMALKGDVSDLKSADYNYLKKKMIDLKSVNADARFVYLMGYNKDINKLFFYVDSESPGSKDYSPPGQIYDETTQLQIDNYTNGVAYVEGPYKDRWGKWVTASAPIFSPDTGLPIAIVAIDVAASEFIGEIAYAGAFSLLVSILIAFFFILTYRTRLNYKNSEINTIKLEFSSFISHEIRGFVTKIRGSLSMLYQEQLGKLTLPQQTFVNDLLTESDEFGALVEEFLDISSLEQESEIVLTKQRTDLVELLHSVKENLSEALLKKDVTIVEEGTMPETIQVSCDKIKIGRVFSNIIMNAIKYSPERGSIRLGYSETAEAYIIAIRDNGIGIPLEEQPNLFKKFFRATNAREVHVAGTGLGLYFSKLIIEKHGGKIWFESLIGHGSTFFVSLPKNPQDIL